jgi:hypothetical protein
MSCNTLIAGAAGPGNLKGGQMTGMQPSEEGDVRRASGDAADIRGIHRTRQRYVRRANPGQH